MFLLSRKNSFEVFISTENILSELLLLDWTVAACFFKLQKSFRFYQIIVNQYDVRVQEKQTILIYTKFRYPNKLARKVWSNC